MAETLTPKTGIITKASVKKGMCIAGGYVFFGLGIAGIVLPLLPTTIFWIMAVWLLARAHPQLVERIYRWPRLGPVVRDFAEDGTIGDKAKLSASLGILGLGGFSLWLTAPPVMWTGIIAAILLGVVSFIISRPIPQ
jgi:uncharacterized protein